MFLLGAVFEILFDFLIGILLEVGVLIFPGTGHGLAYLVTGGWAYRDGRTVGDALASVVGVAFWLGVAALIAFLVMK